MVSKKDDLVHDDDMLESVGDEFNDDEPEDDTTSYDDDNNDDECSDEDFELYDPKTHIPGRIIQATDLFEEPQCTICNCRYRLEADQKYIDSIDPQTGKGTYSVIQRFLRQKGIDVHWRTCKIHATSHIRTKYDDEMPIVYGDKLVDMQHELKECDSQIDTAIAALFERLFKLGSYSNTNSLVKDIEITKGIAMVTDKLAKLWDLKNSVLQAANQESMQQRLIAVLTNILSVVPEDYHEDIRKEIKKLKL